MKWLRRRLVPAIVSASVALLFVASVAPAADGNKPPQDESAQPQPGCSMLPAANVEAVFGHYDSAVQNGGYLPEAKVGASGKLAEHSTTTCIFRRTATREVLQIIGHYYPSYDDASAAFAGASQAASHGVSFYTKGVRQGPVQMFVGKGRAVGYVNNSVAIVHWLVVKGTVPEPADVAGEKLTPLVVRTICAKYPDCGKASNP